MGRPFSFVTSMTAGDLSFGDPALVWGEDGLPRSGRFGDVYFSSDDGLAESRAVFLAGCVQFLLCLSFFCGLCFGGAEVWQRLFN